MDTQKLFRQISEKMAKDFEISAEISHNGNKGTYRENALSKFLSNGRLPGRYAIGSGEIVAPTNETSKQSDLIIYDKLEGISLLYEQNIQVHPVECVYGVVEVKSTLTKEKLFEALENIKSLKEISTQGTVTKEIAPGFRSTYKRAKPFGAVFAYKLGKNSLESLKENLLEWESRNEKEAWPNIIAVLGEGIISHQTSESISVLSNEDIQAANHAISISYKEDTLFRFYSALLDLCSSTKIAPVELWRYFDRAEKISGLLVRNHDRLENENGKKFKLNQIFLSKVYDYCQSEGTISNEELLMKRFGAIPQGISESTLKSHGFLYNPEGLPGINATKDDFAKIKEEIAAPKPTLDPAIIIFINDKPYVIPLAYISDQDLTEI